MRCFPCAKKKSVQGNKSRYQKFQKGKIDGKVQQIDGFHLVFLNLTLNPPYFLGGETT